MKQYCIQKPIIQVQQIYNCLFFIAISICFPFNKIAAQDSASVNIPITIKTEQKRPVKNVLLSAMMDDTTAVAQGKTNAEGICTLTNLTQGKRYKVSATKTDEAYAGVTTFDIAVIIRHIQGVEYITSPYSLIAADVDENGEIDAADILYIRNFILRRMPTLPRHSWRFIDKKYIFVNPSNPFNEDFNHALDFTDLVSLSKGEFVAIKVGDVSSGLTPQSGLIDGDDDMALATRSNKSLTLLTEDRNLEAGKTYTITLKVDNFNAIAYQFSLGFKEDEATINAIEMGDLGNMTADNFSISKNTIATSWDGAPTLKTAQLLTLTFTAHKNTPLSEILSINNNVTRALAFDAQGNSMNLNLLFSDNKKAKGTFALLQNYPNPLQTTTIIPFNLPQGSAASLTVFDAQGRVITTIHSTFQAGYNEITLDCANLNITGMLYYRLTTLSVPKAFGTEQYSATRSLFVVR